MTSLIRSALLMKYAEVARSLGVDPERMIQQIGGDRACLQSPDLRVPEQWLAEVMEVTERTVNCPSIGVLMAESWRLSDFGPLSLLLLHQPTLRLSLSQLERYRHLLSATVSVHVDVSGDVAFVHLRLITDRANPGRQAMDLSVANLHNLMKSFLGADWKPRSVHFSHSAPASLQLHQRCFGTKLEFGSDFNGILLDRQDLDRPNPMADATAARYVKDFLDQIPRAGEAEIAASVRRAVHLLLPLGRSSIEQVGQKLGMSSRTLQRRLEHEGEDFSAIVNDVRRSLASRYLGDRSFQVSQVATMLGFSEVSTFSRWFSAQFGKSPSRWRADLIG